MSNTFQKLHGEKKNMRRKVFHFSLIAAFLVATLAFAGTYQSGSMSGFGKSKKTEVEPFEPGYEVDKDEMGRGYSHPGRIDVAGKWDFTLSASFLYWQMFQEGLDFIYHFNTLNGVYEKVEWDFKFKPAFKIMAGMFFHKHDNWQLSAEYIRHYSTNDISVDNRPGLNDTLRIAYWVGGTPVTTITHVQGRLKNGIDILNFSLGRAYYLGSHLIIDPFFGLRADWIHDKFYNSYIYNPTGTAEFYNIPGEYKVKSWAVGPRAGFESKFLLGEGWRFFGNGAVSLVYKRSTLDGTIRAYDTNIQAVAVLAQFQEKDDLLRPELELGLGFGWGTYFDNRNWHFDLSAGYDFLLFFNQQVMSTAFYETAIAELVPHDIYLHGLTITATFDF